MMFLDICFGNKSAWRILMLYSESPGSGFTRQDLRNYTKLGNKALSLALKRLISFGILLKSKKNYSLGIYKLNKANKYTNEIITMLQRERKELNYLPYDFSMIAREFCREIIDNIDVSEIYLFGSVAKGTYRNDSDIDFAVTLKKKTPKVDMVVSIISDRVSKKFDKKIQCFLMVDKQIKEHKSELSKEILKHGIKII